MTVERTNIISGPLVGNGVTKTFPFDFHAASTSEVRAELGGFPVDPSQFTVALEADGTGSITFFTAPVGTVFIYSDPLFTQEVDFENQGPFYQASVNEPIDRSALRDLVLKEALDRAFKLPRGGGVDGLFPVVLPGNVFGWASGTGADAALRTDLASSISGAGIVAYVLNAIGSVTRNARDKLSEFVSLKDFKLASDPDYTLAMARAVAHCKLTGAGLRIPAGDYFYSVSPNWAVTNLVVKAEGRVNFYYTGTGNALIFDAGPSSVTDYINAVDFCFGNRVHLYAPSTAKHGVYVRSCHHCRIGVNVHGCGPSPYAGLRVDFAVCTQFDVVVSGNEGGWFLSGGIYAKPGFGYYLSERNPGETTSYCLFANPIVEGVPNGIWLAHTLGNVFLGGTSEGCSEVGIVADLGAMWDRFIGVDMEVNTVADVYCNGLGIEFMNCDTYDVINLGSSSRRCVISGGGHETIVVDTGSRGASVVDTVYDRRVSGGSVIEDGTNTHFRNIRQGGAPYAQWGSGQIAYAATVNNNDVGIQAIPVGGAKFGDFVKVSFSASQQACEFTAYVSAAGTVSVRISNDTGANRTFSGTLYVQVERG